jgi:invasion protein IalB
MRSYAFTILIASAVATAAFLTPANGQQSTTATYADWVLQCQIDTATPPKKTCEITQTTQVQGKNQPFSRVAVPNVVKGQPVKIVVQLPVNVSFRAEVGIHLSDGDALVVAAPFDHCMPSGCFAEFELKDDVLKKLYASEGAGKVTFKDSAGKDVSVPLSFKGFRPAFDALSKG